MCSREEEEEDEEKEKKKKKKKLEEEGNVYVVRCVCRNEEDAELKEYVCVCVLEIGRASMK
jgi:hypothetical protein